MTYRQRKQAIVAEYNQGASIESLSKKYSYKVDGIEKIVKLKRLQVNPNFFNIDFYDCWIVPTSSDESDLEIKNVIL